MINITEKLPKDINYYQINKINLHPIRLDLVIDFVNPIDLDEDISISFEGLVYFAISKTPEDSEGCFQIGDVQLFLCEDIKKLLSLKQCGLTIPPDLKNVYYLKIEGDIFIELVSKKVSIQT